ncbi:GNAT family N-acetyltransferase [Vibrio tubiashii]|uniref:GNAT family N-acetyltransferase n=1 Tax=Vibrio tubiashii TaxID=29498 RepID=UPI001EFDF2A7|nr:GNAT family N-acetyltransferase [Vibrio tubiashii]MCG9578210.1 GNAT family N-acetyltransferase [Vibrio tubiashii]
MDYKYLKIHEPLIRNVMALFDIAKSDGGTSSISLESAVRGESESVVLICQEKNQLIGAIEFSPIDDAEVRIRNLVVKETHRRKGIGTELLERAELRIISENGSVYIKAIPMPQSYELFSKCGFSVASCGEYDWYKKVHRNS